MLVLWEPRRTIHSFCGIAFETTKDTANAMQRQHDMGGLEAGPVDRHEHDHEPWEKQVDAIMRLVCDQKRRIMTVDELRRGIEDLGPGAYEEMSYYERWIASVTENLLEKGVISVEELGRAMEDAKKQWRAEA